MISFNTENGKSLICFISNWLSEAADKQLLNKYFGVSIVILILFVLVASLVSPKAGFSNANIFPFTKADSAAFLDINNSHYHPFDKWMIWFTKYGRDAFWPIVIILLFVLGGWKDKKTAVVC